MSWGLSYSTIPPNVVSSHWSWNDAKHFGRPRLKGQVGDMKISRRPVRTYAARGRGPFWVSCPRHHIIENISKELPDYWTHPIEIISRRPSTKLILWITSKGGRLSTGLISWRTSQGNCLSNGLILWRSSQGGRLSIRLISWRTSQGGCPSIELMHGENLKESARVHGSSHGEHLKGAARVLSSSHGDYLRENIMPLGSYVAQGRGLSRVNCLRHNIIIPRRTSHGFSSKELIS